MGKPLPVARGHGFVSGVPDPAGRCRLSGMARDLLCFGPNAVARVAA